MPVTLSERLVALLCSRTFLSLWTEPNPIKRPGKELCDVLIVCDPDVVVFSVKEVGLQDVGRSGLAAERWRKRAIDASVKQLYGAERWLRKGGRVQRADSSPGLALPPPERMQVHRVAVALGSRAQISFEQGDFGKGFVHVLDEAGLDRILGELDTVTDFVNYLMARENLVASRPVLVSAEEDLLAVYLNRGRQFPAGPDADILRIQQGAWSDLVAKPEWARRKEADRGSTAWDGLVETFHKLVDPLGKSPTEALDHLDGVLRTMAREDRLSRRILGSAFLGFMHEAAAGVVNSRMLTSPSGVVYVFLASDRAGDGETSRLDRETRRRELALRCFVARGLNLESQTVVGIATERYVAGGGLSLDGYLIHKPLWTADDQRALDGIQRDLGYFRNPRPTATSTDEYPPEEPTLPHIGATSNGPAEET